ncbi:MAG: hypothetical protein Q4F05_03630 [bacterium]|nr:hypothetical protein [bacterium]
MSRTEYKESASEAARQLQFMEDLKERFNQVSNELGRPLTACIRTFGC